MLDAIHGMPVKSSEILASFSLHGLNPASLFSCAGPRGLYREADLAATHDIVQEGVDFFHLADGRR